jgi:hypothetical protein
MKEPEPCTLNPIPLTLSPNPQRVSAPESAPSLEETF